MSITGSFFYIRRTALGGGFNAVEHSRSIFTDDILADNIHIPKNNPEFFTPPKQEEEDCIR